MAWGIEKTTNGYEWYCFNSAYGAAGGTASTLAEAKVALAIAEADMMEHPFPPGIVREMQSNPEKYAKDFQDPPVAL